MANSKFEYVRAFEREEYLLPNTWIVVRIDGRGFHKIATRYSFTRPSDIRALNLMNAAARHTLTTLPDLILAYGHSDEYSFVFARDTTLFDRRSAKLVSTVVSTFTAAYVSLWPQYMNVERSDEKIKISDSSNAKNDAKGSNEDDVNDNRHGDGEDHDSCPSTGASTPLDLAWLPTFDGRAVCYPSERNLRDYLSWRQVDCHINNLYNTTFWSLVLQGNMSNSAAETFLKGTLSSDKNEILFSRFGINYNNEPAIFRRGTVVYRDYSGESFGDAGGSRSTGELDGSVRPQQDRNVDTDTGASATQDNTSEKENETSDSEIFRLNTVTTPTPTSEAPTTLRPAAAVAAPPAPASAQTPAPAKLPSKTQREKQKKARRKANIIVEHVDIVKDEFWEKKRWVFD